MPSSLLAHSPADVVRKMVVDLGLATLPSAGGDWPAYVSIEPDGQDDVITLYDTDGRDDGRNMYGERNEHSGVLVRVRSGAHPEGYAKARAIAVALDESVSWRPVSLGGSSYVVQSASRTTDVMVLGKESLKAQRYLFTVNFAVTLWLAT